MREKLKAESGTIHGHIPVSVVILCRNEAANLSRCIAAARSCAEVVVIDDGSADGSRGVARSLGARVAEHVFQSFAEQRNWAMDHAGLSQAWVLHLDADEVMTPEAFGEIEQRLSGLRAEQVGLIARKIMLDGRWLRYSADYPVYVPRLVNVQGPRFAMRGHGDVVDVSPEAAVFLSQPMLHFPFSKGWSEWRERHRRYAAAEAARIRMKMPGFNPRALTSGQRTFRREALRSLSFRLPGRPLLRFVYAYIVRLGFLDGRPGLRFCLAMAEYESMINRNLAKRV